MNMPITKTADEERIAELEAQLAARNEALKVARDALAYFDVGGIDSFVAREALAKIEELLK